jgi:tetraacyldisaccharide 4'-kinase
MSIVSAWYKKSAWLYLLWPLSLLYRALIAARRFYWLKVRQPSQWESNHPLPAVPVIVVGNITAGGTGKTPFVIALGKLLLQQGLRPAVISRGYGGEAPHLPFRVTPDSSPLEAGDEAVLIARSLKCLVVVDPVRTRARDTLLLNRECNVIISDDGLQHYAMARDIEIVIIDGSRGLGNELCLPAGPLREPRSRLRTVDYLVINGGDCKPYREDKTDCTEMHLRPQCWVNVRSGMRLALDGLPRERYGQIHALAGIGNPDRFFNTVASLDYQAVYHPFPDHHAFTAEDLQFAQASDDGGPLVLMTEKDAVKCLPFAGPNCWYLAVTAEMDGHFAQKLLTDIESRIDKSDKSDKRATHGS